MRQYFKGKHIADRRSDQMRRSLDKTLGSKLTILGHSWERMLTDGCTLGLAHHHIPLCRELNTASKGNDYPL